MSDIESAQFCLTKNLCLDNRWRRKEGGQCMTRLKKLYKTFISILIEDYSSHKMVNYPEVAIINKGITFP